MSKNKLLMSKRVGKFQISTWDCERVVPSPPGGDFIPERVYNVVRACVQHSRYNRRSGEFERQQVWCDEHDLKELMCVFEELASDENENSEAEEGQTVLTQLVSPGLKTSCAKTGLAR